MREKRGAQPRDLLQTCADIKLRVRLNCLYRSPFAHLLEEPQRIESNGFD